MALLLRAHDATSSPRSLRARICALACLIALTLSVLAPTAAAALTDPAIQATSALLIEPTSGTVLYELNADETRYPASTTKIMTALVTLENADLTQQITVEEGDFTHVTADSSVAGFEAGEVLTVEQLLYGLMLPSGNDASYILARAVAGDVDTFVQMMNDRAAELGCTGTHFANPCGLHDDNHYTTAADLALMFREALKHPEFAEISSQSTWELPATEVSPARELEATDDLIDPESPVYMGDAIVASKTGTTWEGGRCLVTLAERDGMSLLGVTLGAPMEVDADGVGPNFYDMRSLLEWGFGAWRTGEVVSVGDALGTAEVSLSADGDEVEALATSAIVATVPADTTLEDLTLTPSWDEAFQAPLSEGASLGEVTVALGERELGTVTVGAARAMALSIPDFAIWWLTSDPVHTVLAVVVVVAVCMVIGLVAGVSSRSRKSRRQAAASPHRRAVARSVQPTRLKPPAKKKGKHVGSHMRQ